MSLIQALNWRYATKRMNGEKVPPEKINTILEATRLSASSMGLQPYTILVIEDEELRQKIQKVANNQPQIVEASHLLVFAAWSNITEEQVTEYINHIAAERGVDPATLAGLKNALVGMVTRNTPEQNFQWAARQAYIAFGTAIAAAATEQVDATPMEGFNALALDELLNLKEKGLRSVTLLPLGYRDENNDWLAKQKKVRRTTDKLFLQVA
ncbi:nitroreductase family protein [Adhaeribacter pallidiroseus]|uniref:Oxygen-insensitive NAD(P)H nitroreductase n=1 Tax=Adhaeribacter pallidiroseus TaxID=2072847 RepID=A0A369QNS9_9BACT|nr:nitroreductase family protein [Adhaeribacter pallidiroseus]RDC66533.1 Oxygen-insensitive NAD(P)H nitroreductase [Adhaeribacter pallidiroseus]